MIKKITLLLLFCAILPFSVSSASEMKLKPIDLPEDKGKEEVEIYCGSCHSLRLVVQQRMKKNAWDELIVWMVEEQGMDKIPADDRTLVLDYLAKYLNLKTAK